MQPQQGFALDGAQGIPSLAGAREEVEVVRVGVRVVEVASLTVRGAAGVPAREALQHDRPLAAARELPRGRESHRPTADHHDAPVDHASIVRGPGHRERRRVGWGA